MIDNNEFDNFTIQYFGIDWELESGGLVCKNAHAVNLFKAEPILLYINWAAAMQIQFNVEDLDQSFKANMKQWARKYLKHFVAQAKQRTEDMIDRFVKPFEKYIEK